MNAANGVYKGALDCAKQTVARYVCSNYAFNIHLVIFSLLQGGSVSPVPGLHRELQPPGQLEHCPLALI